MGDYWCKLFQSCLVEWCQLGDARLNDLLADLIVGAVSFQNSSYCWQFQDHIRCTCVCEWAQFNGSLSSGLFHTQTIQGCGWITTWPRCGFILGNRATWQLELCSKVGYHLPKSSLIRNNQTLNLWSVHQNAATPTQQGAFKTAVERFFFQSVLSSLLIQRNCNVSCQAWEMGRIISVLKVCMTVGFRFG